MTVPQDEGSQRLVGRKSDKTGLPPGSAVFVGEQVSEEVHLTLCRYDEELVETIETSSIKECLEYAEGASNQETDICVDLFCISAAR
jgi:hypothetical protein